MNEKTKVIFVCTGNICRSPTAEGVCKSIVKQKGIEDNFVIKSAGTHAMPQYEPDSRSALVAESYGVSLKGILSTQFTKKDAKDFNYIVALDESNYRFLINNVEDKNKVVKLASFITSENLKEVPDPYYNDNFEYVYLKIEEGVKNLLKHILKA